MADQPEKPGTNTSAPAQPDKKRAQVEPEPLSLVDSIKEWMQAHGYGLEMTTAKQLQDCGLDVMQSEYYEDTDEETWREIDVAARKGDGWVAKDKTGKTIKPYFDVFLVAECKSSPIAKRPWVVFSRKNWRLTTAAPLLDRPMSPLGRKLAEKISGDPEVLNLDLFALSERHGYSAAIGPTQLAPQAKGSGGQRQPTDQQPKDRDRYDHAYKAMVAVASAAKAKAEHQDPEYKIFRMVVPAIVVSHELVECYLDDKGELRIVPVQEMTLVWRNKALGAANLFVQILTPAVVPAFAKRVITAFDLISKKYEKEISELAKG